MIGRAVHGVLQVIDFTNPEHHGKVVAAQALRGSPKYASALHGFVRSALGIEPIREAAALEHWREDYVGATDDDGVLDRFVDLIYRRQDGTLLTVDYKTHSVPDFAIPARIKYYALQRLLPHLVESRIVV